MLKTMSPKEELFGEFLLDQLPTLLTDLALSILCRPWLWSKGVTSHCTAFSLCGSQWSLSAIFADQETEISVWILLTLYS